MRKPLSALRLLVPPRRGPLLVVVLSAMLLAVTGCGDMYYQTRYIPVSADDSFSLHERMTWSGDKEVYELPANPPAIDTLHRQRVDCKTPGQKFKGQTMLGIQDPGLHPETADVVAVGALDKGPFPGAAYPPQKDYPVGVPGDPIERGAREPIGLIPVGDGERGPFPFRGSGTETIPAQPVGAYRDDQTFWCPPQ